LQQAKWSSAIRQAGGLRYLNAIFVAFRKLLIRLHLEIDGVPLDRNSRIGHAWRTFMREILEQPRLIVFEGIHCTLTIERPSPGVVLATFRGHDIGEFGDAPFIELAKDLAGGLPIELFVDARRTLGASIDVSNDWARWMLTNRVQLHRVNLLCGSRFIQLTANFVRRFTGFEGRMRIYTDAIAFEQALESVAGPDRPG
jgi:hypothetical protein